MLKDLFIIPKQLKPKQRLWLQCVAVIPSVKGKATLSCDILLSSEANTILSNGMSAT